MAAGDGAALLSAMGSNDMVRFVVAGVSLPPGSFLVLPIRSVR